MRVLLINGPNLNLLGSREPEIYGSTTLAELEEKAVAWGEALDIEVECSQSNSESQIIEWIQRSDHDGIVINPAALSHTSRAIADAIESVETPAVEVHISNIRAREEWRRHSVVTEACVRTIYGRGLDGYRAALRHLAIRAAMGFETVRYGPHDENIGDLRRGGDNLAVLVHGGLWRQEHERDSTETLAVDLARRGLDTWNLEYRRLGVGGGWPASGHDVLTALDFIPHLEISAGRVIVVSHSAGSQLAAWALERTSTEVDFHVALAPLLDLESAVANDDMGADEARRLLAAGAPPATVPIRAPTVVVHGDADQIVPIERTLKLVERHALVHHRTECDHFSLLDPTRPEWAWATERAGVTQ
jgi:3-dehydroquinate dehydratase-2